VLVTWPVAVAALALMAVVVAEAVKVASGSAA
jgi:hypothetical protein